MGRKPTTNNETKDSNNSGLKWAPQALRPLVSCILSLVSYKKRRMYEKKTRHHFNGFYIGVFLGGKLSGPRGG
jgi:hypothetical protein